MLSVLFCIGMVRSHIEIWSGGGERGEGEDESSDDGELRRASVLASTIAEATSKWAVKFSELVLPIQRIRILVEETSSRRHFLAAEQGEWNRSPESGQNRLLWCSARNYLLIANTAGTYTFSTASALAIGIDVTEETRIDAFAEIVRKCCRN